MIEWNASRYADPIELAHGQGDPLDLATTTERAYNRMFPGFNNVVRYIRVYSALCWMAAQVQRHLKTVDGEIGVAPQQVLQHGMQKMELALMWANGEASELAGKTRQFPVDDRKQRLTMDAWTMGARLMAAVQYQPSITNGLGFLRATSWAVTDYGQGLANAFEDLLGPSNQHLWLRDIAQQEARASEIQAAQRALSVFDEPTSREREAFMKSFFPSRQPNSEASSESLRRRQRWLSLHLILRTIFQLEQEGAARGDQEIRAAMGSGITPNSTSVVSPGLEETHALWAVIQVRLLHRMALETILHLVIEWVRANDRTGKSIADCAVALGQEVEAEFAESGLVTVADLHVLIAAGQRGLPTLALAASIPGQNAVDIYYYLRELKKLKRSSVKSGGGWLRLGLTALAVCAVETGNFQKRRAHSGILREMELDRNSLLALHASFRGSHEMALGAWAQELVLDWVFSRYSEVATHRATLAQGQLRFDFIEGEFGLELGLARSSGFEATQQSDKLETAVKLLEQCGLLSGGATHWSLTRKGKKRVLGQGQHLTPPLRSSPPDAG